VLKLGKDNGVIKVQSPIRLRGFEAYFKVLTIPLIVMIFWSIIVFAVAVVGMLSHLEMAGSLMVGGSLAVLGSLIGMFMALLVGFNSAKQDLRRKREYAKMGAIFGGVTSIINGTLSIAVSIFTIFTGVTVSNGLQGIALNTLVDMLVQMQMLGPLDSLVNLVVTLIGALFYFVVAILSGALLAAIGGLLTKRFI